MKFRGPLFFSFLLVAFLVAAFYPPVDNAQKEALLMRTILTFLNQLHFQPKDIDDQFSENLYDLYLDRIDGARRFLTQEDIARLEPYKELLDDEALAGTYNFFDLSLQMLEAGIDKTQEYYKEILQEPFDFDAKENLELDGEKRPFSKNDQELREFWEKYLNTKPLPASTASSKIRQIPAKRVKRKASRSSKGNRGKKCSTCTTTGTPAWPN